MYFRPHFACPNTVDSSGPWMLVIFWNRPRAVAVGLAAVGFHVDSRRISSSSAFHSDPKPHPCSMATDRTDSLTARLPTASPTLWTISPTRAMLSLIHSTGHVIAFFAAPPSSPAHSPSPTPSVIFSLRSVNGFVRKSRENPPPPAPPPPLLAPFFVSIWRWS